MTYKLTFLESAKKEWDKLDPSIKNQFKNKLSKIILNPHILNNKLTNLPNCYKIKLRSSGYRLVYRVFDNRITVQVVAIGKRDKSMVYALTRYRIQNQ